MKLDVDPDDVMEKNTDDRGRFYLGAEYADHDNVQIAILDEGEGDDE